MRTANTQNKTFMKAVNFEQFKNNQINGVNYIPSLSIERSAIISPNNAKKNPDV